MTLWTANFEVAPSGSPIPLTGGAAAFDDGGNDSPGGLFVSDSTVPAAVASGTYCAKISTGSSGDWMYRVWFLSGTVVFPRFYLYLTSYPTTGIGLWYNYTTQYSDGPTSRLRLNSNGTLGLSVAANTTTDATTPIPLNTLVRVEASFNLSAGTMSVDAYLGHSTTAITGASVSRTGQTFPGTTLRATLGGLVGYANNYTLRTDAWAVSDVARPGPVAQGSTVTGATPTAYALASGGAVTALSSAPVSITGTTATVVAQGGNLPEPPPLRDPNAVWPPDPYRDVIRSGGYSLTYTVDAFLGGAPVAGATGLQPTGGSIIDTTKPGVRRVLNLELAPEPGLFDRLSPIGTQLKVTAHVEYLNNQVQDIPMGVFDIDSEKTSVGGGGLTLTAPDKWARLQRARFIRPESSAVGMTVVQQIQWLIWGALGLLEPIRVTTGLASAIEPRMGAMVWEKDRDKAIIDLAAGIGVWVYFDRDGVATIADIPTIGASADWLIDASASGVLIDLDRERSRTNTRNVVVVESSATDNPFVTQVAWDDDAVSPTFAGFDPYGHPESAGPFGIVPHFFDTPLPITAVEAWKAGRTILARVAGLASQVSLGSTPNPAVDAFHVIDVLPPRERYDIDRVLERHVVDTVTHPLTATAAQSIEGRSTRSEETEGS